MRFSFIVGLSSLLGAGAATAARCRPSRVSVSSSTPSSSASSSVSSSVSSSAPSSVSSLSSSSLSSLSSSVSSLTSSISSSISSSASASSSAAPSHLPCGTNLLPDGAHFNPGTSAVVETTGAMTAAYPPTCYGQLLPNTCVRFAAVNGGSGTFAVSVTVPTVAGRFYLFQITAEADHLTPELVRCLANNSLFWVFGVDILTVDGTWSVLSAEFAGGSGVTTTTITCSSTLSQPNFDFSMGGFSITELC
ncbi:hypothetical protein HMPREF1624_07458 [Sporothrix schenckii ATCC 58251]|uniref:REJ domain-containing protein n=1 Tax=Sporothrix schenckii (strain ATCC 58251 / de Perez 2211183) TaxID=1391915 RepID=U7PMI6_SPOS1|nr:hypothetical protein HMPREF1624_07458 [Sporothrix schenckii ATCC 58251]